MKPELRTKIVTYGLYGCAGVYGLYSIINMIMNRGFGSPRVLMLNLVSLAIGVGVYLCFGMGIKESKLIPVGFVLMMVSGGYSVLTAGTSVRYAGIPSTTAMTSIIFAIVYALVGLCGFLNNKKEGTIIKRTAWVFVFGGIVEMAKLFLAQNVFRTIQYSAVTGILFLIYNVLFWTIMIYDACKTNLVIKSDRPSEQTYVKKSPMMIYVIMLFFFFVCGLMMISPSKPSGSGDKPWEELGVSESEYWKVYKDIYDKSR